MKCTRSHRRTQHLGRKRLALALACALAAPAHAINLAANGKGQLLIFPYYTVRNGFDTIVSVTNTSDRTVLASMLLRESRNGRPVGGFKLLLSPRDVWTGAVTSDGASGAVVRSYDRTCAVPPLLAGPNGSTQVALSAERFTGVFDDQGGASLERLQEGFVEVAALAVSSVPESAIPGTGSSIDTAAQHVDGTPRSCGTIEQAFPEPGSVTPQIIRDPVAPEADPFSSFGPPQNVLYGTSTLINIGSGQAYDVTPTTIQNWLDAKLTRMTSDAVPGLEWGSDNVQVQRFDDSGQLVTTTVGTAVDAVSLLLMAGSISNDFAAGSGTSSSARTDWVLTFPTKHFYTDRDPILDQPALPPFTEPFHRSGRSCHPLSPSWSGREEQFGSPVFPAVIGAGPQACYSTNVLAFPTATEPDRSVFGSAVRMWSFQTATEGSAGWAHIRLMGSAPLHGVSGLPVTGFAVIERNNSAQAGNNRNYGSGRPHVVDVTAP